jgi:hypothetical protein
MKTISLFCDIIFLIWIVAMLIVNPPNRNIFLFSVGLCFLLVINIIAIATTSGADDFLSLYFKKKKLEQQIEIKELEKKLE